MYASWFQTALVMLFHLVNAEIVQRSGIFETKENTKVYTGNMIKRQRIPNYFSCTQRCLSEPLCATFNYYSSAKSNGFCELYKDGGRMELANEPGWTSGYLLHKQQIVKHLNFTFTTLGATGQEGPTDTSGYQGTTLQYKVMLDKGIQRWQVPLNGTYVIEAWGASGGGGAKKNIYSRAGGKGAYMKGSFNLTRGALLEILVGQAGGTGNVGVDSPGGGGGGTFVVLSSGGSLIIAGGGGGGGLQRDGFDVGDAGQITEEGSKYGGSNGTGGKIHEEGSPSNSFEAGAGGGLKGDGETGIIAEGGKSFENGGKGGSSPNGGYGGFGGGGAGMKYPGAGGGYSGGGVFKKNPGKTIAGGGGSLNRGANPVKKAGENEGDGRVTITLVDLA